MNFLQHKREIQLTQSTRCDFISAVLSNKFLYKVWSPTPFERTFVYGWTDSLQFLMKKSSWIDWNVRVTVNPLGWPTWRGALNCETNDWILRKISWRCPGRQKTKDFSLKDAPLFLEAVVLFMWSSDRSDSNVEMASVREDRPNLMWKPSPGRLTNIHRFQSVVNHSFGLNLGRFCF